MRVTDHGNLGFAEEHALVLYVYLTEEEDDTALLTVCWSSIQSLLFYPPMTDCENWFRIVLYELIQLLIITSYIKLTFSIFPNSFSFYKCLALGIPGRSS